MPTAPFGLAYGLGAGMAIAPQQMFNRQEQANQLAMQGLQQQLMQHQVAQQQAEDQAFSQPVPTQMQSVTQTQPGFESALAANQTLGGMKGPGGEDLTLAAPTQTVQKPVEYVTPYQKMAYEYSQRADKLANMGFGRSAMALQQQAAQMYGQHMDVARGMAVQSMIRGDKSGAINALNSIGIPTTDMGKFTTPDGEMFFIKDPSGNNTIMSREDLTAVAADPSKVGDIMMRQDQYRNLYGYRLAAAQTMAGSRERIAAENRQSQAQQKELDRQNRVELANIRASVPAGMRGSTNTADERKVQALMRDTGISAAEAWDRVKPDVASRGQITDKDRLHALTARNAEIRKNLGSAPTRDDPEYQEYLDNQNTIQGLMRGGKKSAPTSTPVVDVASERSMAAAALAAHPEAADRIKSAFKAKTRQDY